MRFRFTRYLPQVPADKMSEGVHLCRIWKGPLWHNVRNASIEHDKEVCIRFLETSDGGPMGE